MVLKAPDDPQMRPNAALCGSKMLPSDRQREFCAVTWLRGKAFGAPRERQWAPIGAEMGFTREPK